MIIKNNNKLQEKKTYKIFIGTEHQNVYLQMDIIITKWICGA